MTENSQKQAAMLSEKLNIPVYPRGDDLVISLQDKPSAFSFSHQLEELIDTSANNDKGFLTRIFSPEKVGGVELNLKEGDVTIPVEKADRVIGLIEQNHSEFIQLIERFQDAGVLARIKGNPEPDSNNITERAEAHQEEQRLEKMGIKTYASGNNLFLQGEFDRNTAQQIEAALEQNHGSTLGFGGANGWLGKDIVMVQEVEGPDGRTGAYNVIIVNSKALTQEDINNALPVIQKAQDSQEIDTPPNVSSIRQMSAKTLEEIAEISRRTPATGGETVDGPSSPLPGAVAKIETYSKQSGPSPS